MRSKPEQLSAVKLSRFNKKVNTLIVIRHQLTAASFTTRTQSTRMYTILSPPGFSAVFVVSLLFLPLLPASPHPSIYRKIIGALVPGAVDLVALTSQAVVLANISKQKSVVPGVHINL